MKLRADLVAVLAIVALVAGCSEYNDSEGYLPPDLSGDTSGLTIGDVPLDQDGSVQGDLPEQGRYLGFIFQARDQEVYDISLERLGGTDIPALALYHFDDDTWSEPLAWATADAREIGIYGWEVPRGGTYLALVEVLSGPGDGDFLLTLRCVEGCEDPVMCETDADCMPDQSCFNGECITLPCDDLDSDGFLNCEDDCDDLDSSVNPAAREVCDGKDNDCDGVVDEGCDVSCDEHSDCPLSGYACCEGVCTDILSNLNNCGACGAVCAAGETCLRGLCMQDRCTSDADCDDGDPQTEDYCLNGVCAHR